MILIIDFICVWALWLLGISLAVSFCFKKKEQFDPFELRPFALNIVLSFAVSWIWWGPK